MEEQNKIEVEKTDGMQNFYSPFVRHFIERISWDFGTEEGRAKAVELIAHFLSLKYPIVIPYEPIMKELRRQLKVG
ncbi:hypothetical protein [Acinetobacter brisouii]